MTEEILGFAEVKCDCISVRKIDAGEAEVGCSSVIRLSYDLSFLSFIFVYFIGCGIHWKLQ